MIRNVGRADRVGGHCPTLLLHQGGAWRLAALDFREDYYYLLALGSVQSTFRKFSSIYTAPPIHHHRYYLSLGRYLLELGHPDTRTRQH